MKNKCKQWLKDTHAELFGKVYPEEAPVQTLETIMNDLQINGDGKHSLPSEDQLAATGGSEPKKQLVEDQKPPVPEKQQKKSKKTQEHSITIKRQDRNKRKCTTTVTGLEHFDIDLKKAAKLFAGKFACGSSVTKSPQGHDEIVIQGDVQDTLVKLICDTWSQVDVNAVTIAPPKTK